MIKFIPELATLTRKGELKTSNGHPYMKISIAVDDVYYWCTLFNATATYINNYGKVGQKVFIKDWKFKSNEKGYDIIITSLQLV